MSIGLVVNILSFLLVILISFMYFGKKRINVFENNIYGYILKVTLIGFTVNTLCFICDIYFTEFLYFRTLLIKFYYVYLLSLIALLTAYLLNITGKNKYNKLIILVYGFVVFLNFILPLRCETFNGQIFISGPCFKFTYIIYGITVAFWVIYILFNYGNNENRKKIMPVILYSIFSIPMLLIQYYFSELMLEPFLIAYVLIFMYHTIENPDAKILEELYKSKEISDSANEEKTLFLYNMTQEIKNITGLIDNDANMILESNDLDVVYDSARNIKATTSKFINMTNDILDVSNIDSSTIKIYNSKYNLKLILKQIVNIYNDKCDNKGIKFITNIDHNVPENLYGDSIGLKEVLNTIMDNSIKYTDKGFVELAVNSILKNDICRLIITVEDSGIGIKSEDINMIKLGKKSLARANKKITMMNGTMLISSEFGKGSKIKVILDQKIESEENTNISKFDRVFENINILCVNDSEAGLTIVEKLLKGTKISIDKALTGKECLDFLKVNDYDIILIDEDLSSMSGMELMMEIKEIRNFNTPVILLTEDNSYEYNSKYLDSGFSDYLLKPIKKNDLLDKINKYVGKDK